MTGPGADGIFTPWMLSEFLMPVCGFVLHLGGWQQIRDWLFCKRHAAGWGVLRRTPPVGLPPSAAYQNALSAVIQKSAENVLSAADSLTDHTAPDLADEVGDIPRQ